jgi:hypothetical protein
MTDEEIIRLEDLKNLLDREVENLERRKQKLDYFARIVKEVNENEEEFLNSLQELENLNGKMLLYFDESDVCEKLQAIKQDIERIKFEYEQKEFCLKEEIIKTEFDDKILDKYHKDLCLFLDNKAKIVKSVKERQRKVFDESINKIIDKFTTICSLIGILTKKIESIPGKIKLKEFLSLKQEQIEKVKAWIPLKVEDLEEVYRKNADSFKGLYRKINDGISSLKEELRRFAIENGLIEEKEIAVLEIIYEIGKGEFEFNNILEILKGKMPTIDVEEVQNILLSLSRKGFLILKLIV